MPVTMLADGRIAVVHIECGQRRQLEEWTAGVEQIADAVAREHLAAFDVKLASAGGTTEANPIDFVAQALDERVHRVAVAAKLVGVGVEAGFNPIHLNVLGERP